MANQGGNSRAAGSHPCHGPLGAGWTRRGDDRAALSAARAISRSPVTPPAPWMSTCLPRCNAIAPDNSSAVSAGTRQRPATGKNIPAGFCAARSSATRSAPAQRPLPLPGHTVHQDLVADTESADCGPTALTTPAASKPSAGGGVAPTSQPPRPSRRFAQGHPNCELRRRAPRSATDGV